MIDNYLVLAATVGVLVGSGGARRSPSLSHAPCASASAEPTTQRMAELTRLQAETAVRIEAMREMLASRQAELQRAVNERLDSVSHASRPVDAATTRSTRSRACSSSTSGSQSSISAQKNITDLASQVTRCGACSPTSNRAAPSARGAWRSSSRTACRRAATNFSTRCQTERGRTARVPAGQSGRW